MSDRDDGLAIIRGICDVSRETIDRLDRFTETLTRWSRAKNLVGPQTLGQLWTRHIADSIQAYSCMPDAKRWADLGSGAGFPGMVIAILLADQPGARVDLVESNGRKCAFLRAVQRETGAAATIHCSRIEDYAAEASPDIEVVTARALAPLPKLIGLAEPLLRSGATGVFHKGQDVERELTDASIYWKFRYQLVASRTHRDAALVVISDVQARSDRAEPDPSIGE